MMKIAFIVNCTAAKHEFKVPVADFAMAPESRSGPGVTPESWQAYLAGFPKAAMAGELYKGQYWDGCMIALRKLRESGHDVELYIASAGLGIVHASASVPSYEATFSTMSDTPIKSRYNGKNESWLMALTSEEVVKSIENYDLAIACVSTAYERPVASVLGDNVLFLTTAGKRKRQIVYDTEWLLRKGNPYRTGRVQLKGNIARHFADHIFPELEQDALDSHVREHPYGR